ncbi:energy-coupling factor transporter ATPase [Fenollaria sporofastidiosus]|uniref:energy-coupling factor transporter ATPase n=1 Tax=Fenollaria sporofastidiosus TaxID=2811778 RepID=UPI001C008270|nr:energy-coupling factor transporter ATPase [Fenollaria sporofastidiosus]
MIEIQNLSFIYNKNTPFEVKALDDISLTIKDHSFIGIIGHTGSGKSTFMQQLNGLLRPTSGTIIIDGVDITQKEIKLNKLRESVGMVFQYPEYQLFEETVAKDVAFGPKNLGLSDEEVAIRVKDAIEDVKLDYEWIKDRSPFELSGGQKRRVAIAGILAMRPKVLILDEPTAGLDPRAREEILNEIYDIYKKSKITVVLVSHSMEDVFTYANEIVVLSKGRLIMHKTTDEAVKERELLKKYDVGVPEITEFMFTLQEKYPGLNPYVKTVEEARKHIEEYFEVKKNV